MGHDCCEVESSPAVTQYAEVAYVPPGTRVSDSSLARIAAPVVVHVAPYEPWEAIQRFASAAAAVLAPYDPPRELVATDWRKVAVSVDYADLPGAERRTEKPLRVGIVAPESHAGMTEALASVRRARVDAQEVRDLATLRDVDIAVFLTLAEDLPVLPHEALAARAVVFAPVGPAADALAKEYGAVFTFGPHVASLARLLSNSDATSIVGDSRTIPYPPGIEEEAWSVEVACQSVLYATRRSRRGARWSFLRA